jgi:shikimate kinase
MDAQTRGLIRERGISVWLRAELDVLLQRVARRSNRPLLKQGDPREVLGQLIERRHPVYAEADIVVDSVEGPPELTLGRVVDALQHYFKRQAA